MKDSTDVRHMNSMDKLHVEDAEVRLAELSGQADESDPLKAKLKRREVSSVGAPKDIVGSTRNRLSNRPPWDTEGISSMR
jgi:hypothetical protein